MIGFRNGRGDRTDGPAYALEEGGERSRGIGDITLVYGLGNWAMVAPFPELENAGGGAGLGWEWESSSAWEVNGKSETPIKQLEGEVQRWSGLRYWMELRGKAWLEVI